MNTKRFAFSASDQTLLKELSEHMTTALTNHGWIIVDSNVVETMIGYDFVVHAYHREAVA